MFRRSQICLGHNQFVRLDTLASVGGFPTSGATEDSTLGYALGRRGILIRALPMVELTDLPETSEKVIRQNARWYLGVLQDIPFLWRTWRAEPTAFNLAQLLRHAGNKVVEWPIAALVYPVMGYLGWYLAYTYRWEYPNLFYVAIAAPTLSLAPHDLGGRHHDPVAGRGLPSIPAARRRPRPEELQGEVPRHVPVSDVLAPRDAGRLARALEPRADRALRGGEDGSRAEGRRARPRARRIRRRD